MQGREQMDTILIVEDDLLELQFLKEIIESEIHPDDQI